MKILLVCMEHDYGDPSRGRSYEYFNFYDSLRTEHTVEIFDYMQLLKLHGKKSQKKIQKVYILHRLHYFTRMIGIII